MKVPYLKGPYSNGTLFYRFQLYREALSREYLLEMVLILAGVYSGGGALFLEKGGLFEESPYFWLLFRGKFIQKEPF